MSMHNLATVARRHPVSVDYDAALVRVRDDIVAAHREVWSHIASPGSWWTGAERIAIAAEARNAWECALCIEREQALSPHAVAGEHRSLGELSEAAVDAIHRVVTDPGRLSRAWLRRLLDDGLSEGAYVELVGVVVQVLSVDTFARAVGMRLLPLPHPEPGEPNRHRPASARDNGAWVATIRPGDEDGPERDLYRGRPSPMVGTALSLVPREMQMVPLLSRVQYLSPGRMMDMSVGRVLTRPQMELVAARVSAESECFY